MAASTGIASAILAPLAPPPATTETVPPTTTITTATAKSLQTLMSELDAFKPGLETATKRLEKIDLGRKKVEANRAEAVRGRTEIVDLKQRLDDLDSQLKAMTKEKDPNPRTFDKTKKNAEKTMANLRRKLEQADKHLEKAGTATAGTTPAQPAATEGGNTRGISSLISRSPFGKKKSASKQSISETPAQPTVPETPKVEAPSDGDIESDDDDVVTDSKKDSEKSPRPVAAERKKVEVSNVESDETEGSEEEEEEEEDEDDVSDQRGLLSALQGAKPLAPATEGRRSKSPTTPRKPPPVKVDSTTSASPKPKKTTALAAPPPPPVPSRKKTPSPKLRAPQTKEESEEDSYFEEDEEEEEEEEEELQNLRDTAEREEGQSDHDDDEGEDEAEVANAQVQALREAKFAPGTQFLTIADFNGVQTGDLTVRTGETLTLVEQRPDDWWFFSNTTTKQQGVVPINYIKHLPRQRLQRRTKPSSSATTLVDAFKTNSNIPAGFVSSDLAPLTSLEEYKIWRTVLPKMTESNLAFADLRWDPSTDKIVPYEVNCQKILVIKECLKIPRVKGEQVRVLDRCVRVCLYDGFEIISNIQTIRARLASRVDDRDLTENWSFLENNIRTRIDDQAQLLIRCNLTDPTKKIFLLLELSQYCQSTVTQEKCEIACGWSMIPVRDDKPPLVSDTKTYNELLQGGHTDDTNVLLCPEYKILRSNGISGMIDRYKRARIKLSVESRETDIDVLYDNLPREPMIVPMNLIKTLVFFRNDLAYQLHKRAHPTELSTTPLHSIFLSTFPQLLEQPDLVYTLSDVYRRHKQRFLTLSSSQQQKREEFVKVYEFYIYPLLQYRVLPAYEFHNLDTIQERRNLIRDMIKSQLPTRRAPIKDILSILLDPNLTDKWTPFTTSEVSFTLQNSIPKFVPDTVVA